jgi:acetyl esterase
MPDAPLDAEVLGLAALLKARGLSAVSPMTAPIAEARAAVDRIGAFLGDGATPMPGERDIDAGGVRARLYPAAEGAPVLVYAHGGSFTVGSLDAWDALMREMVRLSGIAALHVDYRMIPEHRFPAAHEDMVAAARWVRDQGWRFALGGDSAGANLALGAAQVLRDEGGEQPGFLLLHYGAYDTDNESESWQRYGGGESGLSRASAAWLWDNYLRWPEDRRDPRAAPLRGDMRGLPRTLITIGTHDPLFDQQLALHRALHAAGVPARLVVAAGLPHGFIRQGRYVRKVQEVVEESARALCLAMR